jgi:predicted metal-binding membrane protein
MDKAERIILVSIITIAAISWILSREQPDMMTVMMYYNPFAISLFTVSWTIGMAAMMFPAITPMVLLYKQLSKRSSGDSEGNTVGKGTDPSQSSIFVRNGEDDYSRTAKGEKRSPSSMLSIFTGSTNIIFFLGSYLLVWAITGVALLLAWSIPVNYFFTQSVQQQHQLQTVYGIVLIVSGVYQFSPLKRKCLGYCESPLSFFMRRWKSGTVGAMKMGMYHGLYCLGCCWPYFLIMVALGWMNLLWMVLFAVVIFGEKIWSKGVRIARGTGIGFAVIGIMAIFGLIIITPTGISNSNNSSSHGLTSRNDGQKHMGDMNTNMKMSKNVNISSNLKRVDSKNHDGYERYYVNDLLTSSSFISH